MDIIKEPSANVRIHFFRNTNHPNWHFVRNFTDKRAISFYLCSRHLPPHEESGYQDLPIEWAFALEFGETDDNKYLKFVREEKGIKHTDETESVAHWIGENGWYEFTDIKNIEKWLVDFYEFQKQQRHEFQKANEGGKQTAMF
ncbi:MAG: hypothetical protein ABI723_00365 [Bacteroidia bacterium]